ncbi:hypothetical protein VTO42DRAFT_3119 [Malbranchea cinnamomea]
MPAYTSSQKHLIAQFTAFTNARDTVAAKFLKANGWNVERAVDAYYQSPESAVSPAIVSALNQVFDTYRDAPSENPDGIGIEGAMRYFGDIRVGLDEVACLAVSELLQSPSMGEFTREHFVNGWRNVNCESIAKQSAYAAQLRTRLRSESDLFRRVYRYTFPISRMQGQRNLALEIAIEQWRLFFTPDNGGISWNTETTPWLDWWIEFMESKWKRPINKDLWEQTEVLMRKTHEDESMSWWNPEGAWPGAIDDFVAFVQEKRGKANSMDVE